MGTSEFLTVGGTLGLFWYTMNPYIFIPGGVAFLCEGIAHIAWNRDANEANLKFTAMEIGRDALELDETASKARSLCKETRLSPML